jgi:hypothetical protein
MHTSDELEERRKKLRADMRSGRPKSVFSFFNSWKGWVELGAMVAFVFGLIILVAGSLLWILPGVMVGLVLTIGSAIAYFIVRERDGDIGVMQK